MLYLVEKANIGRRQVSRFTTLAKAKEHALKAWGKVWSVRLYNGTQWQRIVKRCSYGKDEIIFVTDGHNHR